MNISGILSDDDRESKITTLAAIKALMREVVDTKGQQALVVQAGTVKVSGVSGLTIYVQADTPPLPPVGAAGLWIYNGPLLPGGKKAISWAGDNTNGWWELGREP